MSDKKPMTLSNLKELLASNSNGFKLIDIRSAEEYNKLHIPAAENTPAEELQNKLSSFSKDDTIVCVCNKGHERSQNAAAFLFSNGFENSFYLEGGTVGWFDTPAPFPK